MVTDDLKATAAEIHDNLIDLARKFAAAERHLVALRVQGLAKMVVDEAAGVGEENAASGAQGSLKIAC